MQKTKLTVTLRYAENGNARDLILQSFLRYVKNTLACRKN